MAKTKAKELEDLYSSAGSNVVNVDINAGGYSYSDDFKDKVVKITQEIIDDGVRVTRTVYSFPEGYGDMSQRTYMVKNNGSRTSVSEIKKISVTGRSLSIGDDFSLTSGGTVDREIRKLFESINESRVIPVSHSARVAAGKAKLSADALMPVASIHASGTQMSAPVKTPSLGLKLLPKRAMGKVIDGAGTLSTKDTFFCITPQRTEGVTDPSKFDLWMYVGKETTAEGIHDELLSGGVKNVLNNDNFIKIDNIFYHKDKNKYCVTTYAVPGSTKRNEKMTYVFNESSAMDSLYEIYEKGFTKTHSNVGDFNRYISGRGLGVTFYDREFEKTPIDEGTSITRYRNKEIKSKILKFFGPLLGLAVGVVIGSLASPFIGDATNAVNEADMRENARIAARTAITQELTDADDTIFNHSDEYSGVTILSANNESLSTTTKGVLSNLDTKISKADIGYVGYSYGTVDANSIITEGTAQALGEIAGQEAKESGIAVTSYYLDMDKDELVNEYLSGYSNSETIAEAIAEGFEIGYENATVLEQQEVEINKNDESMTSWARREASSTDAEITYVNTDGNNVTIVAESENDGKAYEITFETDTDIYDANDLLAAAESADVSVTRYISADSVLQSWYGETSKNYTRALNALNNMGVGNIYISEGCDKIAATTYVGSTIYVSEDNLTKNEFTIKLDYNENITTKEVRAGLLFCSTGLKDATGTLSYSYLVATESATTERGNEERSI